MDERKIGYARVASSSGDLSEQVAKLKAAGCEEIFADNGTSGLSLHRPGLGRALETLMPGDTLVVCTVDRLSRSMVDTVRVVEKLMSNGAEFDALDEPQQARQLQHRINCAPDPAPKTSLFRYAAFRLGRLLIRRSKLGMVITSAK
jgi:DNA invertase Pin-like site-specific DNA recombinase